MPSSLSVELNRNRLHDIAVADAFSTTESFSVDLEKRGEAVHAHLHLDDDLSRVARLEAGNHYVESDTTRSVTVAVDPDAEPVTGKLRIVTGYGSEQRYVDVTVEPPAEVKPPVDVDEALSHPPSRPDPEPPLARRLEPLAENAWFVAVGAAALILALSVGLLADSAVVLLGVGVVIGVVLAALVFTIR